MNINEIEIGDIVNVNNNNAAMTLISRAEVLYIPCATGDSWRFRDADSKRIIYTSEPCTITLLEKHKPTDEF